MPGRRKRLGDSGERLAADYLAGQGHHIVARNVRRREGEIDLITLDGTTLVFVEVKLRRAGEFGAAVEAITASKYRRLQRLAEVYAAEHPELPADQRIDLVAIDVASDGALRAVHHIRSAVEG